MSSLWGLRGPLPKREEKGPDFMLQTILLIFLVLLLIGSLPTWPYSTGWGYYPGGGLGLLLVILLLFVLVRPRRI